MAPANKGSLGGASFRSAISATSYRSCVSHASFRSCVSSVYHECQGSPTSQRHEGSQQNNEGFHSLTEGFHSLTGHSNEGFQSSLDNVSYYSVTDSLAADAQSLPSIAAAALPSLSAPTDKEVEKDTSGSTCLYLGYLFAILAGISFMASNALLPQLPLVDPWLLLLLRSFLQLITMSPFIACARRNPFGPAKGRWKLPIQSIIGGLLIVAIYVSTSRLPPGDLACIFMITPLLTILLSTWLLQERCGLYRSIASILIIIGALLLARPDGLFPRGSHSREVRTSLLLFNIYGWPIDFTNVTFPGTASNESTRSILKAREAESSSSIVEAREVGGMDNQSIMETMEAGIDDPFVVDARETGGIDARETGIDALGMLAAVAVPVMSAYLLILIRQCRQVHYSVLVAWSSLGPLVVATVGLCTLGTATLMDGPKEWLLVIAVTGLGILGNVFMTKAICWVAPSRVAILLTISIVASYILQISMFQLGGVGVGVEAAWAVGVEPAWLDVGGVGVVLLAVVAVGVEDLILRRINLKWI